MSILPSLLRHAACASERRFAFADRTWSCATIDRLSDRVACGLVESGVRPRDRVALHLGNTPELLLTYFACFKLGLVPVPLNVRFKTRELDYVLRHSGASVYVGEPALYREVSISAPSIRRRFVVGGGAADARPFEDLLCHSAVPPYGHDDPDAPAAILYTSGTTSDPKGVVHTQRTLARAAAYCVGTLFDEGDTIGIGSSMVHAAGLMAMLSALRSGAAMTVVLRSSAAAIAEGLRRYRITTMLGLPGMYRDLLTDARGRGVLASLRWPMICGDVVPSALERRFRTEYGREFRPHYGLTEALGVTFSPSGSMADGSLGRALPGVEVKVTDERGAEVPPGTVGEMRVRSNSVMLGYWNDAPATASVLDDGWLRTGDLAAADPGGALWFAGRIREVIVRAGSNISPVEVEQILREHPEVGDAAVVGVPDAELGEAVGALVVPAAATLDREDLRSFTRSRLADYKVPELIEFADELPRTAAGKVSRPAARHWLMERRCGVDAAAGLVAEGIA